MKLADIESSIGWTPSQRGMKCAVQCRFSSQCAIELAGDDFREMDSDFSGRACNLPKTLCGLAIASGLLNSAGN